MGNDVRNEGHSDRAHDFTLAQALPRLLDRRRVLQLFGMAGAVFLVGCGSDDDASDASGSTASSNATGSTSTTSAESSPTTSECSPIPEETAGPYPGDGTNGPDALTTSGVVRSDITSSFGGASGVAAGIPLTITLTVLDTTADCAALPGAAVYVWHCDREGRYSMYSDGVENENYLRGVQQTDANGQVTFQSIFPAAYSGRWPHIHFEVYESVEAATSGGTRYATSQIALPEAVSSTVYATDGYEASVQNLAQTSLENDNVFGNDDGIMQLGSVSGDLDRGYAVALTSPVDSTSVSTGGAGGGPGGPGGGPPN